MLPAVSKIILFPFLKENECTNECKLTLIRILRSNPFKYDVDSVWSALIIMSIERLMQWKCTSNANQQFISDN